MKNIFTRFIFNRSHEDLCFIAYKKKVNEFAKTIRNSKVLDIGCATGEHTKLFVRNNNKVVGIDIIDNRYKTDFKQRANYDNFQFVLIREGKKLPFKDSTFDVVVSLDVIEHIENDLNFVKEIKRILRHKGTVFVATPNRNRLSIILQRFLGKKFTFPLVIQEEGLPGAGSIHFREYIARELISLFQHEGFENVFVDHVWFGLRGRINVGVNNFILREISQCLFLKGENVKR